ncbi:unnamed protein product [Cylicocyclus nassatus]|uniref:Fungal lipase-type domain-containing protein n=1 Tax=Cylicocyclus nassatus TaxID=53992 RepID=A0AA36DNP8_CYLNA|nr:unnamed protein product [Cylicocyclus nassatus]
MQEVVGRRMEKMNVWFLGPGHVSKYFFDAFMSVWNGLRHAFDEQHKFHPDYEIWVTGHSLGGAMASLAAHYIRRKYDIPANQIKLVTFGQPRTGDDEYSKLFNAETSSCSKILTAEIWLKRILPELQNNFSPIIKRFHSYVMVIETFNPTELIRKVAKSVTKKWKLIYIKLRAFGVRPRAVKFGCAEQEMRLKRTFTRRKPLTRKVIFCLFQASLSELIYFPSKSE